MYRILGFYPHNIEPYKIALVHKSSSFKGAKGKMINNERLEFLGDAILDAIVGDIVYRHFEGKREGFLTNARSKIVKRETLNKVALEIGLDRLIKTSTRSQSHNSYVCGNAFEALVGAIYLDRGYDHCMRFMTERILGKILNLDKMAYKEVNFKSKLIEWGQKNRVEVAFALVDQSTDDVSSPVFMSQAVIEGLVGGSGKGYSKKESEQTAAKEALSRLKRDGKFVDAVFNEKSKRTAMEEEPITTPNIDDGADFIVSHDFDDVPEAAAQRETQNRRRKRNSKPRTAPSVSSSVSKLEAEVWAGDDMSLDDVSMRPKSREDIIAEAERAAFEK